MGGSTPNLNTAADIFAEEPEDAAEAVFADTPQPGDKRRGRPPKKRGQAPAFGPNKAKGQGHRDDPTVPTRPLPDWMTNPSLLPKKPPGRS